MLDLPADGSVVLATVAPPGGFYSFEFPPVLGKPGTKRFLFVFTEVGSQGIVIDMVGRTYQIEDGAGGFKNETTPVGWQHVTMVQPFTQNNVSGGINDDHMSVTP